MNSEIACKHLENLAISGCLERLSPATRTTKAITYRTPAGRNFALEVGDTISGKFTQTRTLVLEAQPPGESPDWNGTEGISGITPLDGQFKSTAYGLVARIRPPQRRLHRNGSPRRVTNRCLRYDRIVAASLVRREHPHACQTIPLSSKFSPGGLSR